MLLGTNNPKQRAGAEQSHVVMFPGFLGKVVNLCFEVWLSPQIYKEPLFSALKDASHLPRLVTKNILSPPLPAWDPGLGFRCSFLNALCSSFKAFTHSLCLGTLALPKAFFRTSFKPLLSYFLSAEPIAPSSEHASKLGQVCWST